MYKIHSENDKEIIIRNDLDKLFYLDKNDYFDEFSDYDQIKVKYKDKRFGEEKIKKDYFTIFDFSVQDQIYLNLFFVRSLHKKFEKIRKSFK